MIIQDQDLTIAGNGTGTLFCKSINIRSLPSNIELLQASIIDKQCDFICIQETWKCNNINNLKLDNYNLPILRQRVLRNGGGLGIYTKKGVKATVINSPFEEGIIETLAIKTNVNQKKIVIVNIYRPPGRDLSCLLRLEEWLKTLQGPIIIVGDFNINTLRNTPMRRDYTLFLKRSGFKNKINEITRTCSSTCIDHVLLNSQAMQYFTTKVDNDAIADHYTLSILTNLKLMHNNINKFVKYHVESDENKNIYLQILNNINWDPIETMTADEGVNYLVSNIQDCYKASFPFITRKFNKKNDALNSWMTKDILDKRDKLRKLGLKAKQGGGISKILFEQEKKIYKNLVKRTKNEFISKNIKRSGNNSKKLWDVINTHIVGKEKHEQLSNIRLNGSITTDEKEIAGGFSNYFENAAKNLHDTIITDPDRHKQYLEPDKEAWEFTDVTEHEVLKVINSLKPKTSNGIDGISNKLLKLSKFKILKPITKLFNKSLNEGSFPTHFKTAKVIPIYKKGDNELMTNYRPIALLPTLSKIWEKLLNVQLQEKLDEYEVIINDQYGFRKNHNTINAVQKLVFEVNKQKRNKKIVCAVFIDVSKAFDSCSHEIIVNKLKNIGLNGMSLQLLKDYLVGRNQVVKIGEMLSEPTIIEHGVGQGTILGPLLFKLYLADMSRSSQLKVIHFADDTTFICHADNKEQLVELVNRELGKITEWFTANYLVLHPDKSRVMVFGNDDNIDITMNNTNIKKCGSNHEEKFFNMLGIRIDQKLSWASHINLIENKLSKGLYLLWRFKKSLDTKTKLLIYHAFIRSHLLYGISLWGNVNDNAIRRLNTCHKKTIRGLTNGLIHTEPILKKFNLLSLQDEAKLEMLKLAWSYCQGKIAPGIKDCLDLLRDQRQLRNLRILAVPLNMGRMGNNQIDVKLPKTINRFNNALIDIVSRNALVNKAKKEMINRYREVVVCHNIGCKECRG